MTGSASQNYLRTLGIPLLRGRDFTKQESTTGAHVAVISEAAARLFWPGEDPLCRHFQLDPHFTGTLTGFEVVGVAKDVRFTNLTRIDPTQGSIREASIKASSCNHLFMRV